MNNMTFLFLDMSDLLCYKRIYILSYFHFFCILLAKPGAGV